MKKQFLIPMFLITGLISKAQSHNGTLFLNKPLSADAIQRVEVNTSGGGIEVSGVSATDARIEVYISDNNGHHDLSKEEIQKRLDADYDLTVTSTDHKLVAKAKTKHHFSDWKRQLSISFIIYVPVNVSTNLSTSGGGISLTNLSGTQEFTTSGGGLDIKKLSGHITGNTSGGGINVSDSKDEINLETSGGGIEASHCSGHIKLNTSGGGLHLTDLDGNIKATTSGGGVEGYKIRGELITETSGGNIELNEIAASLEAETSGGNIHVTISDASKFVRLRNSGGSITLQVPKDKGYDLKLSGDRISTGTLINFNGSQKENEVNGSVNGGGIPVVADAGSGKVSLSFR